MAMVNGLSNVKDSRWLQLEVCREFQRNKCTRPDSECKFAHPPSGVDVQNGRVVACYDSIKGRCNRDKPPCKYFHPPQHLKDQLLINGRNHLAFKNALLQQMPLQTVLTTGQLPLGPSNPYVTNIPTIASPYGTFPASYGLTSTTAAAAAAAAAAAEKLTSNFGLVPASALIATKQTARTDRLEVCREFQRGNCKRAESECRFAHPPEHVHLDSDDGLITVCMDFVKSRCLRNQCRYFHPPPHLQAQLKVAQTRAHTTTALPNNTATAAAATTHVLAQAAASILAAGKKRVRETEDLLMTFPGVLPMTKRPALEKSGLPVFQPAAMVSAYQQALAMHQSFVPLAYKWSS
ncbi:muscleblind-like protein 1 isoform X2 [Tetranychus urticae]|uniref:C3H1-type domain-containing protein n=1 Tax=Tetranychus urticae TaxID=32264 RepID=T1K7I8_TETUR|nr:muscleblind-like protein 1 isoform X2 [Tetranychus urticae]